MNGQLSMTTCIVNGKQREVVGGKVEILSDKVGEELAIGYQVITASAQDLRQYRKNHGPIRHTDGIPKRRGKGRG